MKIVIGSVLWMFMVVAICGALENAYDLGWTSEGCIVLAIMFTIARDMVRDWE